MTMQCVIFVEGCNDKLFIESLLNHIGAPNFRVMAIGGGVSKLYTVAPQIQEIYAEGASIGIVLDADDCADASRAEFESMAQRLKTQRLDLHIPADRLFLVPDGKSGGNLETLLEMIAPTQHKDIHMCFSKYLDCLKTLPAEYGVPDSKARIYAYCEAVGNGDGPGVRQRDYSDLDHWNLEAEVLTPLKLFLRKCAGMDPDDATT